MKPRSRHRICVILTPCVVLGGALLAPDAAGGAPRGSTYLVSGGRPPDVSDPLVSAPVLSGDARVAAYSVEHPEDELRRVRLRGLLPGTDQELSPAGWDATAPSVDATGSTVAYLAAPERRQLNGKISDAAVFVTAQRGGRTVTHRVSGADSALPFQYVADCDPGADEADPSSFQPCGPVLSADGRSLAYVVHREPDPTDYSETTRFNKSTGFSGPSTAGAPAQPACATPPPPSPAEDPPIAQVGVTIRLGDTNVGSLSVVARRVTNRTPHSVTIGFVSDDCALRLLASVPGSTAEICVSGLVLGPGDSCTAYVGFEPSDVATFSAVLTLASDGTRGLESILILGFGVDDVVVVRRDADGDGDFTGPQDPGPIVASVDPSGTVVDGSSPSLSDDGRSVAFASTGNGVLLGSRILIRDTAEDQTVVVPDLALPLVGSLVSQAAPSLSGDGHRVAFTTRRLLDLDLGYNPYESYLSEPSVLAPPAAIPDPYAITGEAVVVEVHDLTSRKTILVSPGPGPGPYPSLQGRSYAPVLSRDGSTVAFTSESADAGSTSVDAALPTSVYLRSLRADPLRVVEAAPELVSVHPDGTAAHGSDPTISADGGVVGFVSTDLLTQDARAQSAQVYAQARRPDPRVGPSSLTFPRQQVGLSGAPQVVTLSNPGAGPARLQVRVDGPFTVSGCSSSTLHAGESCELQVRFAPRLLGLQHGRLLVIFTAFDWGPHVGVVALTGRAVSSVTRLDPASLKFPKTGIGRPATQSLQVRNTASTTMTVTTSNLVDSDFRARTGSGCERLQPRSTCELTVRFLPTRLGPQTGSVVVNVTTGGDTLVQEIPVRGATADPTVTFSPTVARPGRVTFVNGENFFPGKLLVLQWSSGLTTNPIAMSDALGRFSVPVVILKGAGGGVRRLTVSMPLGPIPLGSTLLGWGTEPLAVEAPPLVVVAGTAQPPDFVSRD